MPFFSIILPVYNAKKYVAETVKSILNQSFQDFELIVINDGATDGSDVIVKNFVSENENIKFFSKTNGGICQSRNYGIERAKGKYIMFSDHDDIMIEGALERAFTFLMKNSVDVLKFSYQTFVIHDGIESKSYINYCEDRDSVNYSDSLKRNYTQFNNFINTVWNGVYRKDYIIANELKFDETIKFGQEDVIFNLQVLRNNCTYGMINDIYYYHYIRYGQSTSRVFDLNKLQAIVESMKLEKVFFKNDIKDEIAVDMADKYIRSFFVSLGISKNSLNKIENDNLMKIFNNELPNVSLLKCMFLVINKPKAVFKILLFRLHLFKILKYLLKGQ